MKNRNIQSKCEEPTKHQYLLSELLNEVDDTNIHQEVETGESVGKEKLQVL